MLFVLCAFKNIVINFYSSFVIFCDENAQLFFSISAQMKQTALHFTKSHSVHFRAFAPSILAKRLLSLTSSGNQRTTRLIDVIIPLLTKNSNGNLLCIKMETKILKIDPQSFRDDELEEASELIQKGELVAFPTETVYGTMMVHIAPLLSPHPSSVLLNAPFLVCREGVGANALDGEACKKIFVAKVGSPVGQFLILAKKKTNHIFVAGSSFRQSSHCAHLWNGHAAHGHCPCAPKHPTIFDTLWLLARPSHYTIPKTCNQQLFTIYLLLRNSHSPKRVFSRLRSGLSTLERDQSQPRSLSHL